MLSASSSRSVSETLDDNRQTENRAIAKKNVRDCKRVASYFIIMNICGRALRVLVSTVGFCTHTLSFRDPRRQTPNPKPSQSKKTVRDCKRVASYFISMNICGRALRVWFLLWGFVPIRLVSETLDDKRQTQSRARAKKPFVIASALLHISSV